jgi:hypothetical protein
MTTEARRYEILIEWSMGPGRSKMVLLCPFCGAEVTAYRWSLAGSGKRCDCGAKFDYYGICTGNRIQD